MKPDGPYKIAHPAADTKLKIEASHLVRLIKDQPELQIDHAAVYLIAALAQKETAGWESADVLTFIQNGQQHQSKSSHPTIEVELLIAKWFHNILGKKLNKAQTISHAIWQHTQLETLDPSQTIGHLIIGATLLSLGRLAPAKENLMRGLNVCTVTNARSLATFFVYDLRLLFCLGLTYACHGLGEQTEAELYQQQVIATAAEQTQHKR